MTLDFVVLALMSPKFLEAFRISLYKMRNLKLSWLRESAQEWGKKDAWFSEVVSINKTCFTHCSLAKTKYYLIYLHIVFKCNVINHLVHLWLFHYTSENNQSLVCGKGLCICFGVRYISLILVLHTLDLLIKLGCTIFSFY